MPSCALLCYLITALHARSISCTENEEIDFVIRAYRSTRYKILHFSCAPLNCAAIPLEHLLDKRDMIGSSLFGLWFRKRFVTMTATMI